VVQAEKERIKALRKDVDGAQRSRHTIPAQLYMSLSGVARK